MRVLGLLIVMLGITTSGWAQVNPCTTPVGQATANPTTLYLEYPGLLQDFPDGTPGVREIVVGAFLQGVDPTTGAPVTSVTLPRASWTVVAGFPTCYTAKLAQPLAVPLVAAHVGAAKAVNAFGESGWVTSNPFFRAGAPSAPSTVRVR